MKNKGFLLCGILTPLVYVFTVILGGILWPEYNHVLQPVSDLIATGAPNKPLLDSLFALYNLLTFAFGLGLLLYVRCHPQNLRKTAGTLGALFLIAEGIFGLITLFFPEDAGGMSAAISSAGLMHIVFAGLSSLTTMLTILLMGFWFRSNPDLHNYGLYSFLSVIAIFLSGGVAALSVANHSLYGGLIERFTIGGFLQWMFVIGLKLSSRKDLHDEYDSHQ